MKAAMRRSLGLESQAITIAASDEPSDVVGIDIQELFKEVDAEGHHAPNVIDGDDASIEIVCEDMEFVQKIVDVLKDAGDEGASPVALAVAQENMHSIFSRYGVAPRGFAKEALDKGQAHATEEAIAYATESMNKICMEGIGNVATNTVNRLKANVQQFFRRRTAWRNEALRLQKSLSTAAGSPKSGAQFKNAIRIAHMTTGDQKVLSDGKLLLESVRGMGNTLSASQQFLTGLTSLFSWFNKQKGIVDFDKIASYLPESKYSEGMLSVSGPQALFGEEVTMSDFGGKSENAEEMMAIMKKIKIKHNLVWRVKDLDIEPLAPLDITHMKATIGDLVKIGDEILSLYNRFDAEIGKFIDELNRQEKGHVLADLVTSPIRFLRFRGTYTRLLDGMIQGLGTSLDLNFMAATALLSYYQWSLDNNH